VFVLYQLASEIEAEVAVAVAVAVAATISRVGLSREERDLKPRVGLEVVPLK
jgi:hypothetical protein